ncbi:DUF294 nucleotidyltransferase-like domain-containing protein [Ectothiorhodospira mobilis]|uniref:DUF294 nucleotidyltransferase-like domain-containing protein n=1 Tax=Ectothiorhodospira mobilis TaxID=195064 RepID=UPI001EE9332B|nr:DUF294 nucleotidyltransferase-like domain-containing protein [Ectothiorhodospira mobilis]MCG5535426.1 DUF294 nucleotidyltransferase-like domain-containing protein [Ectothiorhodospira mobilis]
MHTDALIRQIHQAEDRAAVLRAAHGRTDVQVAVMAAGGDGNAVGYAVTDVSDALTRRLIRMAEEELGPPPVPYAWVASGSQGRREQTVHTDQDNALILARPPGDAKEQAWFRHLAQRVNRDLDACGLVRCPGGVIAENPRWRRPLAAWEDDFLDWFRRPDTHAVMLAQNFLDLRTLHGDAALLQRLRHRVLAAAPGSGRFLAQLARQVLRQRPPRWPLPVPGRRSRALDLKRGGVLPLVGLARLLAVAHGLPALHTRERLLTAQGPAGISAEGMAELVAAWDRIVTLRARHQVRQLRSGRPPGNAILPGRFDAGERRDLRRALRTVRRMQSGLAGPRTGGVLQ